MVAHQVNFSLHIHIIYTFNPSPPSAGPPLNTIMVGLYTSPNGTYALTEKVRPVTEDDTGLRVLYEPLEEAAGNQAQIIECAALKSSQILFLTRCSIVAIHGIGAHPHDTWCKNVGTNEAPRYVDWLKDNNMLPSVVPTARIMRYSYMS
jgi:hypothetical protein